MVKITDLTDINKLVDIRERIQKLLDAKHLEVKNVDKEYGSNISTNYHSNGMPCSDYFNGLNEILHDQLKASLIEYRDALTLKLQSLGVE
jgi:hypothetical protein